MKYDLVFLDKENDLNKILKDNKKHPRNMSILFVSQWDDMSTRLCNQLEAQHGGLGGEPLYIVNSFDMPHSFVIFKTTKVPHLVQFRGEDITSEDYLPMILNRLEINQLYPC